MTDKQRKEFDEIAKDPEKAHCFVIVPERYYLGMWFANIPEPLCKYGAKSGDLTMMVWRKHDAQTNWHLRYRFRYYLEQSAWGMKDKKDWWNGTITDRSEAEIEKDMEQIFGMMNAGAGVIAGSPAVTLSNITFLPVRGDGKKFYEVMEREKPHFMNMKKEDQLDKEGWYEKRDKALERDKQIEKIERSKPGEG